MRCSQRRGAASVPPRGSLLLAGVAELGSLEYHRHYEQHHNNKALLGKCISNSDR
jgi:hypothetical protein